MCRVHTRGSVVNVSCEVNVPVQVLIVPAFWRFRGSGTRREPFTHSGRNRDNILPFDECLRELMSRWEKDGQDDDAGGDAA
ncbi:MAG: hypothetical protein K5841_00215 [Fretibacterium sp.]|nr:hypothetical protein [Fretibacterium sp.]